jgi:hemolysin activation/secretion protein
MDENPFCQQVCSSNVFRGRWFLSLSEVSETSQDDSSRKTGQKATQSEERQMNASDDRQLEAEADAYQAEADAKRRIDAIVLTDPRVMAIARGFIDAERRLTA